MNYPQHYWFRIAIIVLMLVALGEHPYGYYQFLRWATAICSFYLAYQAYGDEKQGWTWVFGAIGVLFNPIAPFYLEKETWQMLNTIVAGIYSVSLFKLKLNARSNLWH